MLKVLLVTATPGSFAPFAAALRGEGDVITSRTATGAQALHEAAQEPPDLVVVDSNVKDMDARELVSRLIAANAMINTAVVSKLPPEQFHEHFEGLGVLGQLPPRPGWSQALKILGCLRQVKGQMADPAGQKSA